MVVSYLSRVHGIRFGVKRAESRRPPPLKFMSADRFPHGPQSFAGARMLFTRDQAAGGMQPAAHPHHYAPQRRARRRGPSPTRRLELRPQTPPNRDAESMSWAVHRCSRCARQRKQAVRAKSSQNRQKTVGLRVYAFCGACGAGGGGSNAQLRIKTALDSTDALLARRQHPAHTAYRNDTPARACA